MLIVDDEDDLRTLLRLNFKYANFDIIEANNGPTAIELATRHLPDVILLDIMMPEMNGWEVYRILREQDETHEIPILIITALDRQEEIADQMLKADRADFITRPVSRRELIDRIHQLMNRFGA